jgi:4-hydroxyphenylacetate decarboxylase small subunit
MTMTEPRAHLDCRTFAPVDVAKGICHRTKELILADGAACEHYEQTAKCKFCESFQPEESPFLGTCRAAKSQPMTYPDLVAVTCPQYVARATR